MHLPLPLVWRSAVLFFLGGWKRGEVSQFSACTPLAPGRMPSYRGAQAWPLMLAAQPCWLLGAQAKPETSQFIVRGRGWMQVGEATRCCDSLLKTHKPCQRVSLPFRKDIRCHFPPGSPINPHVSSIYNSKKASKLPSLSC